MVDTPLEFLSLETVLLVLIELTEVRSTPTQQPNTHSCANICPSFQKTSGRGREELVIKAWLWKGLWGHRAVPADQTSQAITESFVVLLSPFSQKQSIAVQLFQLNFVAPDPIFGHSADKARLCKDK